MRTASAGGGVGRSRSWRSAAAAIGNLFTARHRRARRTGRVDAAWDAGIRYFDTAPHYGLGLSERRLGAALRERPRDDVHPLHQGRPAAGAATRGAGAATTSRRLRRPGHPPAASGTSAPTASCAPWRRAWSGSASTASTWSSCTTPTTTPTRRSTRRIPALERLRAEGVVGAIGAGMNQSAMLARFVRETDVDVVLLRRPLHPARPGRARRTAARCRGRGVARGRRRRVQLRPARRRPARARTSPTTTRPRRRRSWRRGPRIADVLRAPRHDAACRGGAFPLAHPAVASVFVGARSAEQVAATRPCSTRPSRPPPGMSWWPKACCIRRPGAMLLKVERVSKSFPG